jgi:cyanophycinase
MKNQDKPKGQLIAIGGKEARSADEGMLSGDSRNAGEQGGSILKHVLAEMKGPASRIEVLTTASSEPEEMGEMYLEAFAKLGCENVGVLNLDGRNVDSKQSLARLAEADGIFITGGDQVRLMDKLSGSRFLKEMVRRYHESEFTIAGTSAGAMAMSGVMIREGDSTESLLKGIVEIAKGFSLLPNAIIDTHFMSRGRFARLTEALLMHEGYTALGICEDTALVVGNGELLRVIGAGVVLVLEANLVNATNFGEVQKGQAIYVEGLQIHILAKGAMYSLHDKKFIVSEGAD